MKANVRLYALGFLMSLGSCASTAGDFFAGLAENARTKNRELGPCGMVANDDAAYWACMAHQVQQ